MSDETELDPSWFVISRFHSEEVNFETLLKLLKHPRWEVRLNAAREIRFQPDERALDDLLSMFKSEKHGAVRHMVALALGALHEAGIPVPLFNDLKNPTAEMRKEIAIQRLKELKVKVQINKDHYQLMIPHKLDSPAFIEIGYLMAQLVDTPFPEAFSALADLVPSAVLAEWSNPSVQFVDSYPHGMKFRIYRQGT